MPRNKRAIDREVKVDEILAAAEALFLDRGYGGTTVAAIADGAGVSTNVVYWYFSSKDDLFVAVLDRHLVEAQTRIASRRGEPLAQQIRWVQAQLGSLDPMTAVVHERALESPVVADFHERFHHAVQGFLFDGLVRDGLGDEDATLGAAALDGHPRELGAAPAEPGRTHRAAPVRPRPGAAGSPGRADVALPPPRAPAPSTEFEPRGDRTHAVAAGPGAVHRAD